MANEGEDFFGKCYNCSKEGHLWQDCKKPLKPALKLVLKSENEHKACQTMSKQLNQIGGATVKEGCTPKVPLAPANHTWDRWLGPENIDQVLINSELATALIDNGTQMNVVTPSFVKR